MKIKQLLVALFMMLALSQATIQAQVRQRVEPTPTGPLPDLIIKSVHVLDRFRVQVLVANDSEGKLLRSFLVFLRIYDSNGQLVKTLRKSGKPPLEKGSILILQFETEGQTLFGNRFEVEVDVGNINAESNENNNLTRRTDGPGVVKKKDKPGPSTSATVDLAAINVFPATNGNKDVIQGAIRNLGNQPYSGNRQAKIVLTILKDGEESQQTLGTTKVPYISVGGQDFITFPSPPVFAKVHEYRLTLTISGGDSNAANDSKINTSEWFSSAAGSPDADLEAFDISKFHEGGANKIRGIVRNLSSQRFKGKREARLYFIDQTGGQKQSYLIASAIIKNVAAGEQWEIIGDIPANLKKVKTYTLKLSISAGDDNNANDEKSQKSVPLD